MDTNKKETPTQKKNVLVRFTILIVIAAILIVAGILATSNFNLVDFIIKLHGG